MSTRVSRLAARRVESEEVLNTVELFLPHYNEESVEAILKELENPDGAAGIGVAAQEKRDAQLLKRVTGFHKEFAFIENLPSYSVHRYPELAPIKRLLRLASRLTVQDEIDKGALTEAKDACLGILVAAAQEMAANDPKFVEHVREQGEIDVTTLSVALRGPRPTENYEWISWTHTTRSTTTRGQN